MILVDTNLLLYAHLDAFPRHQAARAWLDGRFAGPVGVGLPWGSLLGFVRVSTNPRVFTKPRSMAQAWDQVDQWLRQDRAWIPTPTEDHEDILRTLLANAGERSNLVPDAHLAALAIEYGLVLQTADRDFSRFPGLRWENPLEA